jgi:hypothetical protein
MNSLFVLFTICYLSLTIGEEKKSPHTHVYAYNEGMTYEEYPKINQFSPIFIQN